MENAMIYFSMIINIVLFGYILYYVKQTRLDASLLAYTQNLAQEKTRECDKLNNKINAIKRTSEFKDSLINEISNLGLVNRIALKKAEDKNEAEYKRGYDAGLEDGRAEKLEIEGELPEEPGEEIKEPETQQC